MQGKINRNVMWFVISEIVFALLALLASLSLIIAIVHLKRNQDKKANIGSACAALFCTLITVISFFKIEIPQPIIYPLNSDTQTYRERVGIDLRPDDGGNVIKIYYSLDGTDPKDGDKYESTITIANSTTICARSKFLWRWSKIVKESYRFEKINYDDYGQLSIEAGGEYDTQEETLPSEMEEQVESDNTEQLHSGYQESPQINTESNVSNLTTGQSNNDSSTQQIQTTETASMNEGLNAAEGYSLLTYVNQYRIEAGVGELAWDSELEQAAQNIATSHATGIGWGIAELDFWPIGDSVTVLKMHKKQFLTE